MRQFYIHTYTSYFLVAGDSEDSNSMDGSIFTASPLHTNSLLQIASSKVTKFECSELETPNNFCLSRFSKGVHIFLSSKTQSCTESVSGFSGHSTDLLTRKSRHTFFTDLCFGGKENLETLQKIQTDRNCWGFTTQIQTVFV